METINKTKSWSFEKIKIDKPLPKIIKKKQKVQINKSINEREDVTTDTIEI